MLLGPTGVGRLATASLDAVTGEVSVDLFPVNYLVHDGALYFRSAPGSKLAQITANQKVAFEVDNPRGRVNWSVVIHGDARRMSMDRDIEESGVLGLATAIPTEKWNDVHIEAGTTTGIRFRKRRGRTR